VATDLYADRENRHRIGARNGDNFSLFGAIGIILSQISTGAMVGATLLGWMNPSVSSATSATSVASVATSVATKSDPN
jgi:hypothetical protein